LVLSIPPQSWSSLATRSPSYPPTSTRPPRACSSWSVTSTPAADGTRASAPARPGSPGGWDSTWAPHVNGSEWPAPWGHSRFSPRL